MRDRRAEPEFGYRAVHVVGKVRGFHLELQIRTPMQHRWAEVFERLADAWGRVIRYGDPPCAAVFLIRGASVSANEIVRYMYELSEHVDDLEQSQLFAEKRELEEPASADDLPAFELESR